jgi:formate hydrogenlyase subunit 3/multisubunit Na+/H+ antiporter MnhD subunit
MRFGAIPFHLWAARVADAAPEIALPVLMAWGPATLAIVAIAWVDGSIAPVLPVAGQLPVERAAVIIVGVASLTLGAVAAWVQDDLEHVVGYSIVQDAGVVILALAALDPSVWAPSRTWLLSLLVARTAFAAWTMAVHARFGTRRVPELAGWARRSPVLSAALLAIAVASVGWPGLAAFEARASVIDLATDDPIRGLLLASVFLPLLYYGRLFLVGFGRHSSATANAVGDRPRRPSEPARRRVPSGPLRSPWSWRTWRSWDEATQSVRWMRPLRPLPGMTGAAFDLNRALLVALLILILAGTSVGVAAGGFGLPAAAAEPAPQLPGRGE